MREMDGLKGDDFTLVFRKMEKKLYDIIEEWKPPVDVIREVRRNATDILSDFVRSQGGEVVHLHDSDARRVCVFLMKAVGAYETEMPNLGNIVNDTQTYLVEKGGFTPNQSKNLISYLMRFGTTDMESIITTIVREEDTRFTDFLRFLQKNGNDRIKTKASGALESLVSTISKPDIRLYDIRPNAANTVAPLRPIR